MRKTWRTKEDNTANHMGSDFIVRQAIIRYKYMLIQWNFLTDFFFAMSHFCLKLTFIFVGPVKKSKLPSIYLSLFDFVIPAAESQTQQQKQTRGNTSNDIYDHDGTWRGCIHLRRISFYFWHCCRLNTYGCLYWFCLMKYRFCLGGYRGL